MPQSEAPLLDLDLLRTAVAIADGGSFSAAADTVHRTPSAISMQVKRMEDLVRRPLFLRDSRSVTPTSEGALVVEHGRRMLALNRDLVARFVPEEMQGIVRLGATDDTTERFLPEMLRRFSESHPGVRVAVSVDSSADLVEQVNAGVIDLGLFTCAADDLSKGEIVLRERLVWATMDGGVAAEQTPLPISVWEDGCAWRSGALSALGKIGRDYRIAFESAHISGQRAAVLADLAVAPLPSLSLGPGIVAAQNLPDLPDYGVALSVKDKPSAAVAAAADHLRASFTRLH